MWIYSLGRTLMKTMPTILPPPTSEHSVQQQHHSSIVLQATIWKMCKGVEESASLMFLLNVSIHPHSYDDDKTMWNISKDWKEKYFTRRVKWIKVFFNPAIFHPHFPFLSEVSLCHVGKFTICSIEWYFALCSSISGSTCEWNVSISCRIIPMVEFWVEQTNGWMALKLLIFGFLERNAPLRFHEVYPPPSPDHHFRLHLASKRNYCGDVTSDKIQLQRENTTDDFSLLPFKRQQHHFKGRDRNFISSQTRYEETLIEYHSKNPLTGK